MLSIHKGYLAAHLLCLCQNVQSQGGLTGGFRSIDLNNTSLGNTADTQGGIQRHRTGGNSIHIHLNILAQTHHGTLAVLLLDLGQSTIVAIGAKPDGSAWRIGIQDPAGDTYLGVLELNDQSMGSSGNYQRWFEENGVRYGHIIDPDTLYPGKLWRAVTVVCPDSGLADALSTALFLLPIEEGQKLLEQCESYAMWVDAEGNMYYSEGFQDLIRT